MTPLLHPVTLNTSIDAPIGQAVTHHGASVLIGEGLRAIVAERMEQVQKHGYTIERDQAYTPDVLVLAAVSYLNAAVDQLTSTRIDGPHLTQPDPLTWPDSWPSAAWRPSTTRDNLVKAAALIWAEIDRLDHAPIDANTAPFFRRSDPETIIPGRTCRECGCTDERACMDGEHPCSWVGPDLCSACEPVANQAAAA